MTGKHRNDAQGSTHRAVIPVLVVVLIVVLGAGAYIGHRQGWFGGDSADRTTTRGGCQSAITVTVAAAPEIAPAVSAAASRWNGTRTSVDHQCVRMTVVAGQPADVASSIAGAKGVTVTGLGKPNGTATVPDVWVPDSSTWLTRLVSASSQLSITGTSVASSPLVVAIPQPVAAALGSKLTSMTWPALLQAMSGGKIRAGIVDPNVDASGLLTLLAVAGATGAGTASPAPSPSANPQAQAALVGAMRALAGGDSLLRADLMGQFPRADDATTLARSLSAAPIPEQALLAFDAAKPPVPLAGVYLKPAPPIFDYPYAVMPDLSQVKADAATAFAAQLTGSGWRNDLAAADLRAADGSYGAAMPTVAGMPTGPLSSTTVPATAIGQALSTWSAVTVPGRMLAVVDVSGSMLERVPTAGGATREAVTVAAAKAGLDLFDDRWALGLWEFSTNMNGTKPYRQLAPISPLATGRSAVASALGSIQPIPNGDTGLYDTVLAAYKAVQSGWDPSRVNSIVIMTDGQNDNPGGLTLPALLAALTKAKDPAKPIEVIAIGIGGGVNKGELQQITSATGGGVFLAKDPSTIGQIFLQAIALRPGSEK